jgi:prevent-host-death family protein
MPKARKKHTAKRSRTLRKVTVREFALNCGTLLDEVERTKEAVVITRRGKPIAKLVPPLLGIWKGRTEITGDIISPIDVEWKGDEENLRKSLEHWRDGD